MASVVDVVNTALGHIGDEAIVTSIDPPDGSVQAMHAARFYPIARDALLEMHAWRCCTRRANLAKLSITPPIGWAFAYSLPNLCVRPIAVLMPDALPDLFSTVNTNILTPAASDTLNSQDFVVESLDDGSSVVYTNTDSAQMIFQIGVTDLNKFTPLMVLALGRFLASFLAGPIIKGTDGTAVAKAQLQVFHDFDLPKAAVSDANARQSNPYNNSTPAPIAARA